MTSDFLLVSPNAQSLSLRISSLFFLLICAAWKSCLWGCFFGRCWWNFEQGREAGLDCLPVIHLKKVPSTNNSRPRTRRETPLRIYTTTKAHISQAILCKAFGGNIVPSRRPPRSSLCRATFQSASSKRRLARTRNISSGASYLHEKHQPPFESSSDPQGDVAALLSSRHTS